MKEKLRAVIIGPGNIGTDLLMKMKRSEWIEPVWMVGIDPESDGLIRARELGIKTTSEGRIRTYDLRVMRVIIVNIIM